MDKVQNCDSYMVTNLLIFIYSFLTKEILHYHRSELKEGRVTLLRLNGKVMCQSIYVKT
jgi:hypothetical protein